MTTRLNVITFGFALVALAMVLVFAYRLGGADAVGLVCGVWIYCRLVLTSE